MNSLIQFFLLLIQLVFVPTFSQNPQFKTLASIDAVEKIKDILVPIIQPKIQGLTVPDVSGSADTGLGFSIDYYISSIVVSSFQFGPSSVVLQGGGVELQLNSAAATLNMNWEYKAGIVKGSGSATDTVTIALVALLALGEEDGKPTIAVSSLSVDFTSISISVQGGASWFYQVLVDIFKNKITGIFENAIQSELSQVVDQVGNYYLKKTPTTYVINNQLDIDYSLLASPEIRSTFSSTSHLGVLEWTTAPAKCVFQPPYLPEQLVVEKLFTFVVSETLGDCIGTVLYEHDLLDYTITSSMIPSNFPYHLNTNDPEIKRIIPNLYKLYPNSSISIEIFATDVPNVIINATNDSLETVLVGDIRIQVQENSTNRFIPAFTLGLTLDTFTMLNLSTSNKIVGSVSKILHNTALISSEIGPIDMKGVDVLVTFFIAFGVQPQLNQLLVQGFPIPNIEGVQLLDGVIYYENSYLQIGADFNYNPSKIAEFLKDQE